MFVMFGKQPLYPSNSFLNYIFELHFVLDMNVYKKDGEHKRQNLKSKLKFCLLCQGTPRKLI